MSHWPALARARIGCVRYLNAKPLIHCYDRPLTFEHPSALSEKLNAGELDLALAPIYDGLASDKYCFVDEVAIASDGPVFSVFLAYHGKLREIRSVAVDPASGTSVRLLQIILAEFHDLHPTLSASEMNAPQENVRQAQLLIGNQAIEFRRRRANECTFLDLGEEWRRTTGLPFVYAAWMMPRSLLNKVQIAREVRELKRMGVGAIEEIVDSTPEFDRDFRMRYLTEHLRYDLGSREKAGIELFRRLLIKRGFALSAQPLEYI